MPIALALFAGDWLMPFPVLLASIGTAFGAFANVCQVFQADDAVWVRLHNASTDEVIALLFQPSLSSTDDDKASCGGTSAFLLQALSQSRIVVSFGSDLFTGIERGIILWRGSHCQVALPDIYPNHRGVGLWCWICHLDF